MKFRTNENGSITLEAALVLPLFLAFVLCLMTIIKLTIVQMSLQNATSEMTKQVATLRHWAKRFRKLTSWRQAQKREWIKLMI
ncbi:pilus assembly protein [Paenibacillus athensensis]|uniref:TadE/TadG family type IV pilus assembly protein n=1 Tax=Paenibacillus athensensis TaxID=1967502 RepID=UPI0038B2F4B1|nr:pilus assembly protein [Paenibacillus athensensis]